VNRAMLSRLALPRLARFSSQLLHLAVCKGGH
jgi:hypothetical protein